MSTNFRTLYVHVFLICTACFAGCSQSRQLDTSTSLSALSSAGSSVSSPAIEAELRNFASAWQGVPYLEGGDSRSGIDAPGLVMVVADQILGLSLPHSTPRQLAFGTEVERISIAPGDIIFFRPTSMPRHVGVYLGSQEFLHSWPDDGVSVARLDDPYWNGAYWAGRRVLALDPSETTTGNANTTSEDPPSRPAKRRVGW